MHPWRRFNGCRVDLNGSVWSQNIFRVPACAMRVRRARTGNSYGSIRIPGRPRAVRNSKPLGGISWVSFSGGHGGREFCVPTGIPARRRKIPALRAEGSARGFEKTRVCACLGTAFGTALAARAGPRPKTECRFRTVPHHKNAASFRTHAPATMPPTPTMPTARSSPGTGREARKYASRSTAPSTSRAGGSGNRF